MKLDMDDNTSVFPLLAKGDESLFLLLASTTRMSLRGMTYDVGGGDWHRGECVEFCPGSLLTMEKVRVLVPLSSRPKAALAAALVRFDGGIKLRIRL
jgi:hypothetical protein